MQTKAKLKALSALKSSRGWALLLEVMEKEQMGAAMEIASKRQMTQDEIHFMRGAIWAAGRMLELPDRLIAQLNTELALAQDDKSKAPQP